MINHLGKIDRPRKKFVINEGWLAHKGFKKPEQKTTEIYIVYQQGGSYGDSFVREVKAFRDRIKARQFEKDCKDAALCLSLAIDTQYEKHKALRQPYADLFRQRKATPAQVKEYTVMNATLMKETSDLITSNTFDPSWIQDPCSDYYTDKIELVE